MVTFTYIYCIVFIGIPLAVMLIYLYTPWWKKYNLEKLESEYYEYIRCDAQGQSFDSAESYFTIDKYYASKFKYGVNYKHLCATSSTLVGLGILGTFIGLACALLTAELRLDNAEATLTTIESLMDGMKTAFWTSVVGMGCSILYGLCFRGETKRVQNQLNAKIAQLDKENLVTPVQLLYQQTIVLQNMGSTMGTAIGGQIASQLENTISELIETITDCVKEQMLTAGQYMESSAAKLKETNEELSATVSSIQTAAATMSGSFSKIETMLSTIDQTINKLNTCQSTFSDAISEIGDSAIQLQAAMESSKESVSSFSEHFAAFSNAMDTQKEIVISLQNSIRENVANTEKMRVNQAFVIESINDEIGKLSLNNSNLQKCAEKLYESIGAVANLHPDIEKIFESIHKGLRSYVDILQNETSGLISIYTNEFTKACESLNGTVGQLSNSVRDSANDLVDAVKVSASEMEKATLNIITQTTKDE